jgi:hypothetical protein
VIYFPSGPGGSPCPDDVFFQSTITYSVCSKTLIACTIAIAPIIIKSQYLFIIYLFFHLIEDNPIPVADIPDNEGNLFAIFAKKSEFQKYFKL